VSSGKLTVQPRTQAGSARDMYIQSTCGIFGREFTKNTVYIHMVFWQGNHQIYGVYIWYFWQGNYQIYGVYTYGILAGSSPNIRCIYIWYFWQGVHQIYKVIFVPHANTYVSAHILNTALTSCEQCFTSQTATIQCRVNVYTVNSYLFNLI